jgi:ATP-dependent DNA helicase RecQ
MAYGLQDVVNQRRMIDDSEAGEDFKRLQRGKLDALLALAEAHDCRRVRLLGYFGQASTPCGNCDNCLQPPATWDGTEAARMALSGIYRFAQHGDTQRHRAPRAFGAGHLIDVLRGKATDRVQQYGHGELSTFGIGAAVSEQQWRGVLRQLLALGHVRSTGEFNTLELTDSARAVLRGEVSVLLRVASEPRPAARNRRGDAKGKSGTARSAASPLALDDTQAASYAALKAWRGEVAREHNLPAYIVFHDATLAEMARRQPQTLDELAGIAGIGSRKLAAYGEQLLRVLEAAR